MTDIELAELVLAHKEPHVVMLGEEAKLVVMPDEYPITMDQADLLFRSMFFRGANY